MPDGNVMFIDYSGPPKKEEKCIVCGRYSDRLCDWTFKSSGRVCSRPICRECAWRPPVDFGKPETAEIDYCPEHKAGWLPLEKKP